MFMRRIALFGLVLTLCTGCLGALSTDSSPVYYELSYEEPVSTCPQQLQMSVRVWPFSAAAPYDRDEMIILGSTRKVRFSPHFRWIAPPGTMIADKLVKDLAAGGAFRQVVAAGGTLIPDVQLSGHVHRFVWEDRGKDVQQPLLDVQVSLWQEEPQHRVLLQKRYMFVGERTSSGSSDQFAEAMSLLVARFSAQLQEDLCVTASGSSSQSSD